MILFSDRVWQNRTEYLDLVFKFFALIHALTHLLQLISVAREITTEILYLTL